MSSSDFRQIVLKRETGKSERLFRAAVSAFCSLTRPSKRDTAQLDELTRPVYDQVSAESRRYVAAALSECTYPPRSLVLRLCNEPVEICAPLLVRSLALTDVDLIAMIGRHGLGHARAIGRRANLSPIVRELVHALDRPLMPAPGRLQPLQTPAPACEAGDDGTKADTASGAAAERIRGRLRALMTLAQPTPAKHALPKAEPYKRLRDTALSGRIVFFHTALADALEVDLSAAKRIADPDGYAALALALRALELGEEQAFMVCAAVAPLLFSHPAAIASFLRHYGAIDPGAAAEQVSRWRGEAMASDRTPEADNDAGPAEAAVDPPRPVQLQR